MVRSRLTKALTTQLFLNLFNLKGLDDLPTMRDLDELEQGGAEDSIELQESSSDISLSELVEQLPPSVTEEGHELLDDIEQAIKDLSLTKRAADRTLAAHRQAGEPVDVSNSATAPDQASGS